MNLYPAIDILDGSAVRLVKGDFEAKKIYDEDPLSAARGWVEAGAEYLHVVDLDGARSGAPVESGAPAADRGRAGRAGAVWRRAALGWGDRRRPGGGRRTVILGTAAFTQAGLLERALSEHGAERVLVSVDVRGGHVTTAGWTETTEIATEAVIDSLAQRGARQLVFTKWNRDGMLDGPTWRKCAVWPVRHPGAA